MNTRITYRYADKTNCKQMTSIVVEGAITWEQIAPYLVKQHSFIPGQIGLEDLQHRFVLPGVDHPWHQITSKDIEPSEATPTVVLSGANLAERFAHTKWLPDQSQPSKAFPTNTVGPDTETHTVAEARDSIVHTYAHDTLLSFSKANGAPTAKRTRRTT